MNEQPPYKKPNENEVDLGLVFGEIKRLLFYFLKTILSVFIFIYKHKFILLFLLLAGVISGYFWDKSSKGNYETDLTLDTYYNSTDYLYNKIQAIETKIKQEDSLYLQQVFGNQYDLVKNVKIEPILDIYSFIAQSESNKEIFELLLDEQDDVDKFLEKPLNSYNYPLHRVKLIIKGNNHHKLISDKFISYINDNKYFNSIKEILLENYEQQLVQNNQILNQIDRIIDSVGKGKNSSIQKLMVSINENQILDDLLQRKKNLLTNDATLKTQIENQQEIIKIADANYTLEKNDKITDKDKKFLLPLFLIGFYMLIYFLKHLISKAKRLYAS
ncbi:hypothetical protein [Mesohalobacter halotolerans]|uniref:Uncharacterized protein n=1 Tax=Mesohalobacter halotolerans TaxID=1883405 RepID=A0A4U5TT97_9FLAO|nr:hypothetical protein [Mesohalobacter halotolerans]TKS57071.1 hypothetical protein FCN74_01245 [Mesohalobacter halotolerans]